MDPVVVACAVLRRGRIPRFVTTAEVFDTRFVGPVLRYFDHIPLDRRARGDADRLRPIEQALAAGECVVVYPEGRLTTDPQLRPVRGQAGIALIAARTGAPIIPVGHWGTHEVRRPSLRRPLATLWGLRHRPQVAVAFAEPVTLPPATDARAAVHVTAEVMRRITALVDALRTGSVDHVSACGLWPAHGHLIAIGCARRARRAGGEASGPRRRRTPLQGAAVTEVRRTPVRL